MTQIQVIWPSLYNLLGEIMLLLKKCEMLALSFKAVLPHIITKQIQAKEFEKDKADPTNQTLQIDYAMAYQCMY